MLSLESLKALVRESKPLQFGLVFLAGAVVAAVFYPTKQIKETLQKTYEQQISTIKQQHSQELQTQQQSYQKLSDDYGSYKTQTQAKINELTNQVSNLKTHTKVVSIKIIHPDGTVEERQTSVSDVDQTEQITQQLQEEWEQKTNDQIRSINETFQKSIDTMQKTWDSKERDYKDQIATLSQSKTETINPKNFTLDVGMLTDTDYYGHVTYNLLGPIVIGLQGQFGGSPAAGAGIGLRF